MMPLKVLTILGCDMSEKCEHILGAYEDSGDVRFVYDIKTFTNMLNNEDELPIMFDFCPNCGTSLENYKVTICQ